MKKLLLLFIVVTGCSKPIFKSNWSTEKSPDTFNARFETSKGSFELQITRNYSPLGVDRFYQLLKHRLYDNTLFYRVRSNWVAQFGIIDSNIRHKWGAFKLPDEKVILSNKRGTIAFARDGKDSRDFDLFINLKDNTQLDTKEVKGVIGYSPFGNVTRGMEVVDSLYSGYGDIVFKHEKTMYHNLSGFLDTFPKLDLIRKAYILKRNIQSEN